MWANFKYYLYRYNINEGCGIYRPKRSTVIKNKRRRKRMKNGRK